MRVTKKNERLSVQAIAGTYVVLLGMNVTPEGAKGLLGFAVRRQDKTENEDYWLKGFKTFKSTDPHPEAGSLVTTREQPIQDFHWGDYTAKPRHDYSYEACSPVRNPQEPLTGSPQSQWRFPRRTRTRGSTRCFSTVTWPAARRLPESSLT